MAPVDVEFIPPVKRVARLLPLALKRRLHILYLVLSQKRTNLRSYSVSPWSRDGMRYLLFDHEIGGNFTYDIANTGEIPQFVADSTGRPLDEVDSYLDEILSD